MPNTHTTLTSLFSDIADAIREKTGDTAQIVADNFPAAIEAISGGGIYHEHGTVAFHTGTDSYNFALPIEDDGYDYYAVYAKATNLWKLVDGEWVDTGRRDFRDVDTTGTNYMHEGVVLLYPGAYTHSRVITNGNVVDAVLLAGASRASSPASSNRNDYVLLSSVVLGDKIISYRFPANHFVCKSSIGQSYEYDIWGWNNE